MSMHGNHYHPSSFPDISLLLAIPFLSGICLYLLAVILSNRAYKSWPKHRTFFWIAGIVSAMLAVVGPLADRAHNDFSAHMVGHLLLGMLAPLCIALSAPVTLFLRSIPVKAARCLTSVLKSRICNLYRDPIIASVLNIGGLWVLYTTNLYEAMHESILLHILIHFHVFVAGYLFTIAIIYVDLTPHRTSYLYRSIVLVIALAAHGILSKYIYINPPAGTSAITAQVGAMIMYYGGDFIDMMIIFILCLQWYKATSPKELKPSEMYS